jgi:hypothetical protein
MAASLTSTDLTLDNTSGASIPGTPSAGQTVLYPKDDKLLYYKDDAGVERRVDAGLGYMLVRDEKAVGTNGGTSTSTTIHTRELNTVATNTIAGASLATNKITLPAGTYQILGSSDALAAEIHRCFLYNVTAAALAIGGTDSYNTAGALVQTRSFVAGRITIAAPAVFEFRHYIGAGRATNGFGVASNVAATGVEVYTTIEISKVS